MHIYLKFAPLTHVSGMPVSIVSSMEGHKEVRVIRGWEIIDAGSGGTLAYVMVKTAQTVSQAVEVYAWHVPHTYRQSCMVRHTFTQMLRMHVQHTHARAPPISLYLVVPQR